MKKSRTSYRPITTSGLQRLGLLLLSTNFRGKLLNVRRKKRVLSVVLLMKLILEFTLEEKFAETATF